MHTPYGQECPYFYGDYYRGRSHEECRLIGNRPERKQWTSELCKTCPVPEITLANACENMKLHARIQSLPFGLFKRMKIDAFCTLSGKAVAEPRIGCGQCHQLPQIFKE
ncbi:MAG: hypothetical protein IT308_08565 [Anaerolineaceae bacterium]|nr:hypothetical protein [Anaerolineaceae bacterium]